MPQHEAWHRELQQKIQANPRYFTSSPEMQSATVQSETGQTQFDTLDYLRQLAQQEHDPALMAEYELMQVELEAQLTQDLRVFLQEHFMLRHQSNVWDLDPDNLLVDWLESGRKAVSKARVKRDQADTSALWQTRHIKYERFQLETRQIEKMRRVIKEFLATEAFTMVAAGEVLGASLPAELAKIGITFPKDLAQTELHPGRLQELGLKPDDQVEVSPKFSLVMPANGFVHPGNLAYAVVYQVVRHRQANDQHRYWLVSDHYYSQLTYEELQEALQWWVPDFHSTKEETEQHNSPNTKPLTERLLMEVVSVMPPEFTTAKPFLIFLQLAEKLAKEAALPGGYSFAFEQHHVSSHLQQQEHNLQQAAALMTQILLSELTLNQLFPERQEYVGRIVNDMFDKVVLGLLYSTGGYTVEGQPVVFTDEMYQEILGLYHEHYVLGLIGRNAQGQPRFGLTTQRIIQAEARSQFAQTMAGDEIYAKQEQGTKKHAQHLNSLSNTVLQGLTSIPLRNLPSCAACAGGLFGKAYNVAASGQSLAQTSMVNDNLTGLPWYTGGWEYGDNSNDILGRHLHSDTQSRMSDFLSHSYSTAQAAARGFYDQVFPSELGTFFLTSDQYFAQLPATTR